MSSTAVSNAITELKVSAHLMTLDPGLFCVFNTPGAAPPDPATGLPGVRLSEAPASSGRIGAVSISGFNVDGWLGGHDGAALVRVVGGAAQVLVTVYQDADGQHDAPKLQVIRLSEAGAVVPEAASAQPAATPVSERVGTTPVKGRSIEVAAHIYGLGDVGGLLGEWMGERGSKRWIEGFGIMPNGGVAASDLEYQAVLGQNWLSPWSEGGQFCGSRGMSLPILGLRIRLRGAAADTHALSISACFVDGTEIGPVSDNEACEAPSLSPLEAFQVTLRPLTESEDASPTAPAQPATLPKRGRSRAAAKPEARVPQAVAAPAKPTATGASPTEPGRKTKPAIPPSNSPPAKGGPKRTSATTRRR